MPIDGVEVAGARETMLPLHSLVSDSLSQFSAGLRAGPCLP
jgi:hypothetical protein